MHEEQQQPDPWWTSLVTALTRWQSVAVPAAVLAEPPPYRAPDVAVRPGTADGPHGDVPLRVYGGGAGGDRPVLVWLHGGGWIGGSLDMHEADSTAREVCARSGAIVVSVDYRLAREGTHFPVPLDDVLAALAWTASHAADIGGDLQRVCLGGASAGGNLAAGAALRLRDSGGAMPASLALVYPALHPSTPAPSADQVVAAAGSGVVAWPEDAWQSLIENYLGGPAEAASPYAMPGLADLTGLPPTLVVTCEIDPLRPSGDLFADQLAAAGVPVDHLLVPGSDHAHIDQPWRPEAQQTYDDLAAWVGR